MSGVFSTHTPPTKLYIACALLDCLLVCTGQRPYLQDLGFENVGLDSLDVNDWYQTSVSNLYAIGGCVHGTTLKYKAEDEGVACVEGMRVDDEGLLVGES